MIFVGLDIGGTNIKAALVEIQSATEQSPDFSTVSILEKITVPTRASGGPASVTAQIHNAIEEMLHSAPNRVHAVGIGVPGSVDHERGIVLYPPNLPGWKDVALARILSAKWELPFYLDNDANCAAVGEALFGAGRGCSNFITLTLGTGIGSGIILNGGIYRGARGYAGEFGHITIDPNGPRCNCGNNGCVEAYVGNSYMTARAKQAVKHHPDSVLYELLSNDNAGFTPEDIAEAAEAGDEFAREFLYTTGEILGIAVASAANLLDITDFVIGGGIAGAGEPLLDGILRSGRDRVLEVHRDALRVVAAGLGNDAGMSGAAASAAVEPFKTLR